MTLSRLFKIISIEFSLAKGARLKTILVLFRLANYYYHGQLLVKFCFLPFVFLYKVLVEFVLGLELPAQTNIGVGLRIYHGVGLVVHRDVVIGENCILRQGVTIGNKSEDSNLVPTIGNNVEFGANAIVIGDIDIGDNVKVGAGAVVTKDIASESIVVSSGFRLL